MNPSFVLVRALHMAACLLVFGLCVFDRFVAGRLIEARGLEKIRSLWRRTFGSLNLICIAVILLTGLAWLGMVVIAMSDLPPREALRGPFIRLVLDQTQFGALWKIRLLLWCITSVAAIGMYSRTNRLLVWLTMSAGGALTASLAWSGHGSAGSWPSLHLTADAIHLLASGGWPIGLLPMLLVLLAMRSINAPQKWPVIGGIVRRFSIMSLTCVALLIASGLVNSWILVGSIANIWRTPYGRTLAVKAALFLAMIAIGAMNLLVLKPRLNTQSDTDARRLRRNVAIELAMGTAVMIAVGLLGLMQPAVEQ